jgi:hypothetical protein
MFPRISPLLVFFLLLLVIAAIVNLGPTERTLGVNVRLVYLHGAWVWTAILGFMAAAIVGLGGLVLKRTNLHKWSIVLGQMGAIYWITYLPISLWTMQANWNGLYLLEPRWRLAVDFAIIALLLQGAIFVFESLQLGSILNLGFFGTLSWALTRTEQVMHPDSPIFNSDSLQIQAFFICLVGVCLLAAWQLARWLHTRRASGI